MLVFQFVIAHSIPGHDTGEEGGKMGFTAFCFDPAFSNAFNIIPI